MTNAENTLVTLISINDLNNNERAILLQMYIQQNGPLSKECGERVREILETSK